MQGTAIITRGGLVLRKIRGLHRGRYELIVNPGADEFSCDARS